MRTRTVPRRHRPDRREHRRRHPGSRRRFRGQHAAAAREVHQDLHQTCTQDLGEHGPTLVDTLSFLGKLEEGKGKALGNTGGECTLLFKTSYHCTRTYRFHGGDVLTGGYYDTASKHVHWPIFGGTEKYRGASGQVDYVLRKDGSYDDTFRFDS